MVKTTLLSALVLGFIAGFIIGIVFLALANLAVGFPLFGVFGVLLGFSAVIGILAFRDHIKKKSDKDRETSADVTAAYLQNSVGWKRNIFNDKVETKKQFKQKMQDLNLSVKNSLVNTKLKKRLYLDRFNEDEEKAEVIMAEGGPEDCIEEAIEACPVECIHWEED